jgi:hypothetical protein
MYSKESLTVIHLRKCDNLTDQQKSSILYIQNNFIGEKNK